MWMGEDTYIFYEQLLFKDSFHFLLLFHSVMFSVSGTWLLWKRMRDVRCCGNWQMKNTKMLWMYVPHYLMWKWWSDLKVGTPFLLCSEMQKIFVLYIYESVIAIRYFYHLFEVWNHSGFISGSEIYTWTWPWQGMCNYQNIWLFFLTNTCHWLRTQEIILLGLLECLKSSQHVKSTLESISWVQPVLNYMYKVFCSEKQKVVLTRFKLMHKCFHDCIN